MLASMRSASLRTSFRAMRVNPVGSNFQSSLAIRAFSQEAASKIRNIGIIAHVDHGKTTLVDGLLRQSQTGIREELDRVMDSNQIEKERGITILSKVTSIKYDSEDGEQYRINIVDTPGHADFGGEVERIMSMCDGVALIVDASEGPMTQTKFVLDKALQHGLTPIVFVNKVDRESARPEEVPSEIFDLFAEMGATDDQLEFPILYGSGKDRWASNDADVRGTDLIPLYKEIVRHVPPPKTDVAAPFSMLVTQIGSDTFMGKLMIGRVENGTVKVGDMVKTLSPEGEEIEQVRVTKILSTVGLEKVPVEQGFGGDIITLAGCKNATVNHTICSLEVEEPIKHIPIDPPTVAMAFSPNDGPMVGQEGNAATAQMIRGWLEKEAETNVSITITDAPKEGDTAAACMVYGRGELQLGIILENMRREGFEMCVSAPSVIMKEGEDGEILEPVEEVVIECAQEFQGTVIDKLCERKADLIDLITSDNKCKIIFHVATRGLIGYRTEFMNDTSGTGVLNNIFHDYVPYKGDIQRSVDQKGCIVSQATGVTSPYALQNLQSRGVFFVTSGVKVYNGMIIGESAKPQDIVCNPTKAKELNNMRAAGKDEKTVLIPCVDKSLEQYISDVRDDEMIEITTKSIRLRKKILDFDERRRAKRTKKNLTLLKN